MNNEWYTPHKYIEAAREVLGEIDLDPASCAFANQVVKAKQFFTKRREWLDVPLVWADLVKSSLQQNTPGAGEQSGILYALSARAVPALQCD